MPKTSVSDADYKKALATLPELDKKIDAEVEIVVRAATRIEHMKAGKEKCRATIEQFWFEHGESEKSKCRL